LVQLISDKEDHMRAYGKFMLALACTVAFATVVAPGTSEAAKECNGVFTNQTINESLVVNDGDSCELDSVTVNGRLTVNGGTIIVNNSTIIGSWSITGNVHSPEHQFCNNNIVGSVTVHDVTSGNPSGPFEQLEELAFGEGETGCGGGTIIGSVTAVNSPGVFFEVDQYTVNGSLTILGVNGGEVEGTTVYGTATCQSGIFNDLNPNTYTSRNNGCPD
jgi:hypothetical protein